MMHLRSFVFSLIFLLSACSAAEENVTVVPVNPSVTTSDESSVAESEAEIVVTTAAYKRNLSSCLNGYSSLCNQSALREEDKPRVAKAFYDQNLSSCLNGYSSLCNQSALREEDKPRVARAFYDQNLSSCLNGYSSLCDLARLSSEDRATIGSNKTIASSAPVSTGTGFRCAENGSCYGDISALTGRPKTVSVRGYYRSDGTYVRGHYRGRPRY